MSDDEGPRPGMGEGLVDFGSMAEGRDPQKFKIQKDRSKRQENSIAHDIGGKRSPSSGAVRSSGYSHKGTPGDVTSRDIGFRIEAKYTDKKSFRIDEITVMKAFNEASLTDMDWAIQVDIHGFEMSSVPNRLVILDWETFNELVKGRDA